MTCLFQIAMKMYAVVVLTLVVSACKLDRTLPLCVSILSLPLCYLCLPDSVAVCVCLPLSMSLLLSVAVPLPVAVCLPPCLRCCPHVSATLPVSVVCHLPCLCCLSPSLSLLSAIFPISVACHLPCLCCLPPSLSLLLPVCLCSSLRVSASLSLLAPAALPNTKQCFTTSFLSATAVCSYAIGPRELSANEQLFCLCSNSSKFVTNNSDYIRLLFYVASSNKTKID